MPTYQYACTECGQPLEAVQSFTDSPLTQCPNCGGRLRKVFSAVGVVFKGSGFYRTDSRAGSNGSSGARSEKADTAASGNGSQGKSSESSSSSGTSSSDSGSTTSDSTTSGAAKSGSAKSGSASGGKVASGTSS